MGAGQVVQKCRSAGKPLWEGGNYQIGGKEMCRSSLVSGGVRARNGARRVIARKKSWNGEKGESSGSPSQGKKPTIPPRRKTFSTRGDAVPKKFAEGTSASDQGKKKRSGKKKRRSKKDVAKEAMKRKKTAL